MGCITCHGIPDGEEGKLRKLGNERDTNRVKEKGEICLHK
jgi:hypothetical protein